MPASPPQSVTFDDDSTPCFPLGQKENRFTRLPWKPFEGKRRHTNIETSKAALSIRSQPGRIDAPRYTASARGRAGFSDLSITLPLLEEDSQSWQNMSPPTSVRSVASCRIRQWECSPRGLKSVYDEFGVPKCDSGVVDAQNSSKYERRWMNWTDAYLMFTQWGNSHFYDCDVQLSMKSIDEESLKLDTGVIYKKLIRGLLSALLVLPLAMATWPMRLALGLPFWWNVLKHTRKEDFVRRRSVHMMWFLVEMIPVWLGCMLSMQVIRYAFGGVLGLSDEATMRSYCRLLYQQQVIRKQRRDMTYLVNIVRHHLLVDEAVAGGSSDVCFGPPCDDQTHADVPWLLRKVSRMQVSLRNIQFFCRVPRTSAPV